MNGARWYRNSARHNNTFGSVLFEGHDSVIRSLGTFNTVKYHGKIRVKYRIRRIARIGRHLASSTIGSMNGARWYRNSARHNNTFGSVQFGGHDSVIRSLGTFNTVKYHGKIRVKFRIRRIARIGRHLASSTIGSMNGARWYRNSARHNNTFGSVQFWVMIGMCHTAIWDVQYGRIRVNMEYYVYMVLASPRNTPSQGCVIRPFGTFNTVKYHCKIRFKYVGLARAVYIPRI